MRYMYSCLFVFLCCLCVRSYAGIIPNNSYSEAHLPLHPDRLGVNAGHHGMAHAWDGYVIAGGNAFFHVFDISDPSDPTQLKTMYSPHGDGEAETHQMSFAKYPNGKNYFASTSGKGIDIWDVTDVENGIKLVSSVILPGINYGDINGAVWGIGWQGTRIYVGATNNGVYVVDVSDPSAPKDAVTRETPDQFDSIPTSNYQGIKPGPIWPVGNLMATGTPKNDTFAFRSTSGIVTFDISTPDAPVVLDSMISASHSYFSWFYGNHIWLESDIRAFDVFSEPNNIQYMNNGKKTDRAEYLNFADDKLFLGLMRPSPGVLKYDIQNINQQTIEGERNRWHTVLSNADDQFPLPLGNLLWIGDDQENYGSFLVPHSTKPDTISPYVKYINPVNEATKQPLETRVGISLSDQIDSRSIDLDSVIVRPVGGEALSGILSLTNYVINFEPDEPFKENTQYEVILPRGGLKDLVGNFIEAEYRSVFSTGEGINQPLRCTIDEMKPVLIGESVSFSLSTTSESSDLIAYEWIVKDSTSEIKASKPSINHTFNQAGRYTINARVQNTTTNALAECSAIQIVHAPLTTHAGVSSSLIVVDDVRSEVLTVNPDNDSLTIIDATTRQKIAEYLTGRKPTSVALGDDVHAIVVSQDDNLIQWIYVETGEVVNSVQLAYGSAPSDLVRVPNQGIVYVTLKGHAEVLKLDAITGEVLARSPLQKTDDGYVNTKGIAVSGDGQRIFVSRFISPQNHGELFEINASSFELDATYILEKDKGAVEESDPDNSFVGRGVPNYLSSMALSPTGVNAAIGAKKDNVDRGLARDGRDPSFESTVRSMIAFLNLQTRAEDTQNRLDINDSELPSSLLFSPLGDLLFAAIQGSNKVVVLDAYSGAIVSEMETGLAPQGLALSQKGVLYVKNFMDRTVSVLDVQDILSARSVNGIELGEIETVNSESLNTKTLQGKQIFYNARDVRMSKDGYLSCASCHIDGGSDERVFDFTDRGEGLRNTQSLQGKSGLGHGLLHWSGNFDEVQDFEHDIRDHFGGAGFMSEEAFNQGADSPLGKPKAGVSVELDNLAMYVSSLDTVPPSPYRLANGQLTEKAQRGLAVFKSLNCGSCHSGNQFTDSASGARHDVGTLSATSGMRSGEVLDGIDTPSLKGVWSSAPYFHDGSAATLKDVIHHPGHGNAQEVNASDQDDLIAYILQIDERAGADAPKPVTLSDGQTELVMIVENPHLHWNSSEHAAAYDVYFGMSRDEVEGANVDSPTYQGQQVATEFVPKEIDPSKAYYLRVDSVNDLGVVQSQVWSVYAQASELVLEAEMADQRDASVRVLNDRSGYSGSGYLAYPLLFGSSTLSLPDGLATGDYELTVRYANNVTWGAGLDVFVDKEKMPHLTLPIGPSDEAWNERRMLINIKETAQSLNLRGGFSFTPYIDRVSLRYLGGHNAATQFTIEAEDAEVVSSGVKVDTIDDGYTGRGFVRYPWFGGTASYFVNAAKAGRYRLGVRYGNGSWSSKYLTIEVNDQRFDPVELESLTDWDAWSTHTMTVDLTQGVNVIQLNGGFLNAPSVDSLRITAE